MCGLSDPCEITVLLFSLDCLAVKAEHGKFYIKAETEQQFTCDLYLTAMPEQLIQVRFDEFNVACEDGGKVSVRNFSSITAKSGNLIHSSSIFDRWHTGLDFILKITPLKNQ